MKKLLVFCFIALVAIGVTTHVQVIQAQDMGTQPHIISNTL